MRNLKKILALVLALVMSFSLMATANAFTDDEQITDTYETAVTVLDGLKVFQGYDDGSFQPQSPIRRSEVAAIIYRIVTGDVNGTGLTDVNDAQLTYDMYNTKYSSFDVVSMLKFLNADVSGDKKVNTADATAIVSLIK